VKTRTPAFERIVSGISSLAGLRELVAALGFGDEWSDCSREFWPEAVAAYSDEVDRFVIAGERSGLVALVLQTSELTSAQSARMARRIRSENPARLCFYVFCDRSCEQIILGSFGASEDFRLLLLEPKSVHPSDLDALHELRPTNGEGGLTLCLRHARVLDRSRVTRRFFVDFKTQRTAVACSWRGVRGDEDRAQLALLMLCRLVFLYFLQKRGHLAGDTEYLHHLWLSWRRRRHKQSFFAARLKPLFFGVLNTRPEFRGGGARRFGGLPYLNGGLFERHALERRHRKLDLPDRILASVFADLLQRYRFTTHDSAHTAIVRTVDAAVDPEMLGRVFEELMAEAQRGDTGTFFTPPPVVDRLVSGALEVWLRARNVQSAADALAQVRVLDPACGSGAFLLGALARITEARSTNSRQAAAVKRDVVEQTLHGVDVQGDAALLCALRIWLTLLPSEGATTVQPLPNLDRRIRQGDALIDPLDFALSSSGAPDWSRSIAASPELRTALKRLRPAAQRYITAEPTTRDQLRCELQRLELRVAEAWLLTTRRVLQRERRELRAQQRETDLFGELTARAQEAVRQLEQVETRDNRLALLERELNEQHALPFFSFPVHYADSAPDGFDLIVSNPPWVRAHRWPPSMTRALRDGYEVCRNAGWKAAASGTGMTGGQVDLSLLFLERSLRLLKPDGVLALLLPAKTLRSLYAGGARGLLLRDTCIARIEDHSLDQHSIFRADAFAAAITALKGPPAAGSRVVVSAHRRGVPPLEFEVASEDLPLLPGDAASPWLLVPPDVARALRKMQAAGITLRALGMSVHRGVFTGANDVLIVDDVRPKLGDHAWIRADGFAHTPPGQSRSSYRALIEESVLRPMLRGAELRAWRFDAQAFLIWSHDAHGRAIELPPRTTKYLARHQKRLRARSAWRPGSPLGAVFGGAQHTTQPKVAWRDLAPTLEAVMLPASVRSHGRARELIPLNTVYYLSPADESEAMILCAYLNSLPVRTFARAFAERAKDAHFRFFAWTIGCLPLPKTWRSPPLAVRLEQIARTAHRDGALAPPQQRELDRLVAQAYGLDAADCAAVEHYDAWLRGVLC
jgi:hypothetical protein